MSTPEIIRAVVTQVTPLRVRIEGPDMSAMGVTPDNYAGTLAVADTVLVTRYPRGQIEVLARLGGPATSDTGWLTPAGSPGGWYSSNSVRVKDGWATINIFLTAASNRAGGTIVGVFPADSRWAHTVPDDIWFVLGSSSTPFRGRVLSDGSINGYGAPAMNAGSTITGTVTYPVG